MNGFEKENSMSIESEKKRHQEWFTQIKQWMKAHPLSYSNGDSEIIKPQYVVEMLDKLTNGEAIIATEVGQHQMWGGTILPIQLSSALPHIRRTWYDGIRFSGGNRSQNGNAS